MTVKCIQLTRSAEVQSLHRMVDDHIYTISNRHLQNNLVFGGVLLAHRTTATLVGLKGHDLSADNVGFVHRSAD